MPNPVVPSRPYGTDMTWRAAADGHLAAVADRLRAELRTLEADWSDLAPPAPAPTESDALIDLLSVALFRAGKRARPLFCYFGWIAGGGRTSGLGYPHVLQASAALELLHVFALLHDDVMDSSATRRGVASLHERIASEHRRRDAAGDSRRFGENIALLVGDLAHAEAARLVAALPEPMRRQWRIMVVELVAGQAADLTGAAAADRDPGFALTVARAKTAGYSVTRPLLLGAGAACASVEVTSVLHDFGRHAGAAFALRDDVLGAFGDPDTTGKPCGDDLRAGKPTMLLALAHQSLKGTSRRLLDAVGTDRLDTQSLGELQKALVDQGVLRAVETQIAGEVDAALTVLGTDCVESDAQDALSKLVRTLAWREA